MHSIHLDVMSAYRRAAFSLDFAPLVDGTRRLKSAVLCAPTGIRILPMSLPIHVSAYSGYKANERPSQFVLDGHCYEIAEVEDRWYEPEAMYFRVRTTEGKRYILRYTDADDEWTLQSGFDGAALPG